MDRSKGHVHLVDDSPQVQAHLGELLRRHGYAVQGYASAEDFLERAVTGPASVLVLDMKLPGASGAQLQRRLQAMEQQIPVIFISGESATQDVIDGFRAGAVDFLWKPFPVADLLAAIEKALQGGRERQERMDRERALRDRMAPLTAREREFMVLMVDGYTNKRIGEITGVAADTVKKYRAQILEKLEVESLPELIVMCRGTALFDADKRP